MNNTLKYCLTVVACVLITPILDYIPTLLSGEPNAYSLSNLVFSLVVAVVIIGYEMFLRKPKKQ